MSRLTDDRFVFVCDCGCNCSFGFHNLDWQLSGVTIEAVWRYLLDGDRNLIRMICRGHG